jgi:hypothetical protein
VRRHRPLVDVLLAPSLIVLVAAPAATAAKPRGFTAAVLAETWTGTWHNQTENTTGRSTLRIGAEGSVLRLTAAFDATAHIGLADGGSATTVVSLAEKYRRKACATLFGLDVDNSSVSR